MLERVLVFRHEGFNPMMFRAQSRIEVVLCGSDDEAVAAMSARRIQCAVLPLSPSTLLGAGGRLDLLRRFSVPPLVVAELRPWCIRWLIQRASRGDNVFISLIGLDDTALFVRRILEGTSSGRSCMALSPIQGMSASQGRELAAAAILAGDARLSVDAFSRLINVPVRTLEWRTNRELGMSPRRLLAWAFVIHAAWRIEYLEETISSTASLGGFPSVSAFSNCFKRYAGFRPSAIIKQGGSADLVSVFRSRVFRRAHN